jgi:hypothetical protein
MNICTMQLSGNRFTAVVLYASSAQMIDMVYGDPGRVSTYHTSFLS